MTENVEENPCIEEPWEVKGEGQTKESKGQ
jgi:hypothetical protein